MFPRRITRTSKPHQPYIDSQNTLSKGLGMVVCPNIKHALDTTIHDVRVLKNLITGDIAAFHNDATRYVEINPLPTEGVCLIFNGNNANAVLDKVVFPSYNPSNNTSSFSVTFRIRVRLVSGSFGRIINAKQGNYTTSGWEIGINNVDDTQLFIRGGSSTITNIATNANFTENKWETFTVVYNGTTVSVYQNGVFLSSGTITAANAATAGIGLGNPPTAQNERTISMDQAFIYIHERILSDGEIRSLHANPYQIFQPRTQLLPLTVTAGGIDLIIQNAAHASISDNVDLTQDHQLVVVESNHAMISDNVTLTVAGILDIQDGAHATTSDNISLTQDHQLAIADALHAHLADNVDLTQDHQLVINDSLHALISDIVTLIIPTGVVTPDRRIYVIDYESRTYVVVKEDRTYIIAKEDRTYPVQ